MRQIFNHILFGAGMVLLIAFGWHVALTKPARADAAASTVDRAGILAAYDAFKDAQNARDPDAIGSFFVDGSQFLWVSDGRSYWGREDVVRRMSSFQRAERWRVLPDLETAAIIPLGDDTAILHLPLRLQIGRTEAPNQLGFLVSIVFQEVDATWKIAALLTTEDKSAP